MASFLKHVRQVSGLTLVSRLAGFARDAVLAHFLGAGQVMSAYATAFALPNAMRNLFGEGALSAAFIPVFTQYAESGDRKAASRFMSLVIVLLVTTLSALTLVVVGVLMLLRYLSEETPQYHLLFGLAAVMFPFAIFVCLVALLQAALNACRHFVVPALAPIVLNLFIIAAAVAGGLWVTEDAVRRAYLIAGAILAAGAVEVAIQVPALRRAGLTFRPAWDLAHPALRRVLTLIVPMALAIGVIEINANMDKLVGYVLMRPEGGAETFRLGALQVAYPMKTGAPAILYYAQRLYWLPLGVFGIALSTVMFPEFSRYALRQDLAGLARGASHAMRLALFVGVPAGAGIVLICEPFIQLFLHHGRFADPMAASDAVQRTVWAATIYATGIWAFSANHVLVRAFYARQDVRTPLRIAALSAGVNLVLDLVLVWPLAERGLALATVVAAMVQLVALVGLVNRRFAHLGWGEITRSAARTLLATAAMGAAVWAVLRWAVPLLGWTGRPLYAVQCFGGVAVGAVAFLLVARLLGMTELKDLLTRAAPDPDAAPPLDPGAPTQ